MNSTRSGAQIRWRHPAVWVLGVAVLISLLMTLAGWRVSSNYSFWKDELFTAAAIADSWDGLLHRWILPDTAPPLYGVLLKAWVGITGPSEWGLRSLSLVFASLSLVAVSLFRAQASPLAMLTTLLFLGLSPGFVGHAQEARNYALTLFWATALTGSSLALARRGRQEQANRGPTPLGMGYAISALALSLSHYFGYLFAVVVLLVDLGRGAFPRRPTGTLALLMAMQIWPLFHLVLSAPASRRLDNVSWIRVTPVIGTLQEYLAGVLPIVGIQAALLVVGACCIALLVPDIRRRLITAIGRARSHTPDLIAEISHLLIHLSAFAVLMLAVDLVRPLSTSRNYVVALPATAFLVGDLARLVRLRAARAWAGIGMALLATALVALLADSLNDLRQTTMPLMNYKQMAETINTTGICSRGCRTLTTPGRLVAYFDPSLLVPYRKGSDQTDQRPVLGLGENRTVQRRLRRRHPGLSCYEPSQSRRASVFLLIRPEQISKQELQGLKPCQ